MFIHYKYATEGSKSLVLYFVYESVCWCKYQELGKWFVDTFGKIFHMNFLGYKYWFMSIRISQLKDHFISVYQATYATYVVTEHIDTAKLICMR